MASEELALPTGFTRAIEKLESSYDRRFEVLQLRLRTDLEGLIKDVGEFDPMGEMTFTPRITVSGENGEYDFWVTEEGGEYEDDTDIYVFIQPVSGQSTEVKTVFSVSKTVGIRDSQNTKMLPNQIGEVEEALKMVAYFKEVMPNIVRRPRTQDRSHLRVIRPQQGA